MSGIVAFDDLFPLKADPTNLDRVFGFDSGDGKSRGFTIQSILDLIADTPVTWGEITGKPPVFPAEAHTIGAHSNVGGVDAAADGTFLKKVAGKVEAVAVDFYGVSNPPPPDPSIDDAVRLITPTKTAQWDTAFGWGNHAGQYRPISYVPSWAEITSKPPTFAPSAHTLGSHSDSAALATATEGQLVRKAAVGFEAFTADYYSPFNPPPPDGTIPDFVRDFTIGQFAGYEAKMLEFSELPDGAVPLIKDGVPADSQLMGIYTENPFDPETEEEDYNAFVEELLYLISAKRIKGVAGVEADDLATLGQVPVLFDDDLAAIAAANAPSGLNPFATIADLFSRSVYDLLQSGATDGQAIVWSDANNRYEPGTVAGGGGADANAVHYNAADSKTATEKQQARDNIGAIDGITTVDSRTGIITVAKNSNVISLTGAGASIVGISGGVENERVILINRSGGNLTLFNENTNASLNDRFSIVTNYVLANDQFLEFIYSSINRWVLNVTIPRVKGVTLFEDQVLINSTPTSIFAGLSIKAKAAASNAVNTLEVFAANGTDRLFEIRDTNLVYIFNQKHRFNVDTAAFGGSTDAQTLSFKSVYGASTGIRAFSLYNSANTQIYNVFTNGSVFLSRSFNGTSGLRRDEQRLYYLVSVTTSGAINDQALTDGIFNYRFTASTSITGFANGEIGRTIDIDNATGATLTLSHENAGSIAANRIKLIGAADLVIPIEGKVTLKYCTGSRWELVSKNF